MRLSFTTLLAVHIASTLLFAVYPCEAAPRPAASMLHGPGIEVDPAFAYYRGRSAESIASEIKVNGYRHVHYVVTADSNIRPDLIRAFHREGLPVWYVTFCHVAYSTKDFPPGWQAWRMKLRASDGGDFVRLCMNNPGYRAWKRQQVAEAVRRYGFDGVELVEPFWPDVPGPESPTYGCLDESCRAAFRRAHPEEPDIPEFTDTASPRYYKSRHALYRKWVDFRVASIGNFVRYVLDGARAARPGIATMVWSVVEDAPNPVALEQEAQGEDAADMASRARPDAVCFQTNWTDWSKPNLPPTYVTAYRPFIAHFRAGHPHTPMAVQLDTGSSEHARQTYQWVRAADRASRSMGALGTVSYEYFISRSMYDDPPHLAGVRRHPGGITLVFQKRIDTGHAAEASNYHIADPTGRSLPVTAARTDGNCVYLAIKGIRAAMLYHLRIGEVADTPSLWLFKGYPRHTVRSLSRAFRLTKAAH